MVKTYNLRIFIISILAFTFLSHANAQPANDICETATDVPGVQSDDAFVCLTGSNLNGLPEAFNNPCGIGNFPTVWFRVFTDGSAALMNIQVTSEEFTSPTISLFHAVPDCANLQAVALTQSNLACVVGSNGEAEAIGTDVGGSAIYYIAVSSLNSVGGAFELCVNTISDASICVTNREIVITARSAGGPLTGPFLPGETISICMNVNSYTAANNGCQWFQGMIPVFGNGWDPSSFDQDGQPVNASINGNNMGVAGNGLYGVTTWDWFADVDYHFNHPFYQLGDFDGNGTLDMCHLLYDADCPNTGGLTGGCCNPCWGAPLGTILPTGWFAYGINGSCGTPGPPIRVDWGDGNSCGGPMGPWSFCFDLVIRDYPDCNEDSTTMDLSLGFFTFADGEVGSWTGGASVCALDQPAKLTLPMCCNMLTEEMETLSPICSTGVIEYVINEPGVEYFYWTVNPGPVTGANEGEGGPGSIIIDTLTNASSGSGTVVYHIIGYAGGDCPVFEKTITINVNPQIEASLDPIIICGNPPATYTITAEATGGSGNYEYFWSPGGEVTSSITIQNPAQGDEYSVIINDESGCIDTAFTTVELTTTLPVGINPAFASACFGDGPITLEAIVSGGIEPYTFIWDLPGGSTVFNDTVEALLTGAYILSVTDQEGCSGLDTAIVIIFPQPEVSVQTEGGLNYFCEGDSLMLTATATGGEAPYSYTWFTPEGIQTGDTLFATVPGSTYSVVVEDNNGCTDFANIGSITSVGLPVVNLGPDTIFSSSPVELNAGGPFVSYVWNTGANTQSITVGTTGEFIACVEDINGCMACDTIFVEIITNTIDLDNSGYLNIYPNPNRGEFILQGELFTHKELNVKISNTMGQIIYTSKPEWVESVVSKNINLGKVVPGVYYVQIGVGETRYVRKIVVE